MKKSVRTTISIPAALKARMDGAGEEINWSAIAAQAFEAKLAEIITRRGTKNMEDVVSRLRASKSKTGDIDRQRGVEFGKNWASNHAEAVELERLEAWTESPGGHYSWEQELEDNGDENAAFGPSHYLVQSIRGETCNRQEGNSFWEEATGEDHQGRWKGAFLVGFVEGAISVWEEVKDQL